MNLVAHALQTFKKFPQKTAIIEPNGQSISFGDFNQKVNQVVIALKEMGVQKGDRVFLLVPVKIDLYVIITALFHMGAIAVFIDPWASKDYINSCLKKVRPDFLIYIRKAVILMLKANEILKIKRKIILDTLMSKANLSSNHDLPCEEMDPEDSALITFTTGSTNSPKGCDRTHGFLRAQHSAHEEYYFHETRDIDLAMFPVFVLGNLGSGITSVIIDADLRKISAFSPSKVIAQINTYKITSMTCSPALIEPLVDYASKHSIILPSMKKFFTGGGPVNPWLFASLEKIMPNARLFLVYGSTEAEPIALLPSGNVLKDTNDITLQGKGITLGIPVEKIKTRIIRYSRTNLSDILPLPAGEIGEIILTGPFVGKKYYHNEEAFKENKYTDDQGNIWHRTGDLGYQNESGQLFMLGRINAIINENDKIRFPLQVEPVINHLEDIKKCAYFQLDASKKTTALLISVKPGTPQDKAILNIKNKMRELDIHPSKIIFTDNIPVDKRHNSKVDYSEVLKMYSNEQIDQLRNENFFKRILLYTNERFPLIAILLFVTCFSFSCFYLGQLSYYDKIDHIFNFPMLIGWLTLFFIFFHIRLFDEFKDYQDDCDAHPERLLSRGVVTLKDLGRLLIGIISIQVILNLISSREQLFWWGAVFIYSFLMFKEFFISERLKKSITLYLLSHQAILPIMISYAISSSLQTGTPMFLFNVKIWLSFLFIALLSFSYEISRKTWSKEREHKHADSYTKTWGIPKTATVLTGSYFLIFLICAIFYKIFDMNPWNNITSFLLFLISSSLLYKFVKNPTTSNSKLVELGGIICLLGNHINIIILALLK